MSEELKAHDQRILDFRTKFLADSENLLLSQFPAKVIELSELYSSSLFNSNSLERVKKTTILLPRPQSGQQSQTKSLPDTALLGTKRSSTQVIENSTPSPRSQASSRRKRTRLEADIPPLDQHYIESDEDPNNNTNSTNNNSTLIHLSNNSEIHKISQTIKPFILDLIQQINSLKLWIELLIPRIEDGNNFGVSVQEEVLAEVSRAETEASSLLDSLSRYYLSRAKIVSKHLKYPGIEDYRIAIHEIDEKKFYSMKILVAELRNIYTTVYDIILKNHEKVKKPRSTNPSSMY